MDEIARWWRGRTETRVHLVDNDDGSIKVRVDGPPGVTVLARGVDIQAAAKSWTNDFQQIEANTFTVRSSRRPFIGVAAEASPALSNFLRQQGYILEVADTSDRYSLYLNQRRFTREDEASLLTELDRFTGPMIQLGRWANGARSALCVSGDIDALTLWDYSLRFLGK
jgi:hypothetical protein